MRAPHAEKGNPGGSGAEPGEEVIYIRKDSNLTDE